MFRHIDAALVRAAVWEPGREVPWPDLVGAGADVKAWRVWLDEVWQEREFVAAVEAASADLVRRVEQIRAGRPVPAADARRTVLAVVRYLLRARTRATPFGLFAGVAPVRVGAVAALRVGTRHHTTAKADAVSSTELIDRFETHPALRPHLMLAVTDLAVERDGHMVIEHRPGRTPGQGSQHVHVRLTPPIREALDGARTPIPWNGLATKVSAAFPDAPATAVDRLLTGLVEQRALLTGLRPAMTVTDPLAALLGHARHLDPAEAAEIHQAPRNVLGLRLDWDLTLPEAVAQEAAAAARALTRLAPRPALTGWPQWHGRFLERYGPHATVPVLDAVDALGYPPGFLGATTAPEPSPRPGRDARLIRLAHTAAVRRRLVVELDDALLEDLATTDPAHPVQPSTELVARVHAPSPDALQRGEFTLHVVGAARSAGSTTGRFLGLLPDPDRHRMTRAYAHLPGVHDGALLAQISSTPLSARAQNLARAPQAADLVISLGDYHGPDTGLLPVADLAVTADDRQLHLVSLSGGRPVHTLLLNAVDLGHHSHPLARFLAEAPVALAVPCAGFQWGTAASHLPFLPALRHGRTILSPARWLLTQGDLPAADTPWPQWDQALTRWRRDVHLPERVYLSEADQRLALDLTHSAHRALLRTHLDRDTTVTLHPAPGPEDLGWTGGRAHEVVIPLATRQDAAPVRPRGHVTVRDHGHLPGGDDRIQLHLYGHRKHQDPVLTRHLPALLAEPGAPNEADDPGEPGVLSWWFSRHHDPADHLRLYLTCAPGTLGALFERVGTWTRQLRHHGLITHAAVETHHPQTARFGGPDSIEAAERYFAADSAAALAQLTTASATSTTSTTDPGAVTAASLADIATGLLGDDATAMRWLIDHTRTSPTAPPRAVYRQAVDLVAGGPAALGERVTTAWALRRRALTAYRRALQDTGTRPEDLLADLLHLHHDRVHGADPAGERAHLHLARAAALSRTARARTTP